MEHDSTRDDFRLDPAASLHPRQNIPTMQDEAERQRLIDEHIAASDAFIAKYGSLAEDLAKL